MDRIPDTPMRFTPRGLVDAYDATDKFPGACLSLSNLVFDQSNPEVVVSRPGTSSITAFAGFSGPGAASVQITLNNRTYGMVASTLNAGQDEPFCYNHLTSAFEAVSNVTAGNTPTTQALSGAWTPPTMAVIGTRIMVTHPGFPGGATKFGNLDISTPTAPAWNAGDLATNALPTTPTAVANYGNRAYFACGQILPFSDVLAPTTRTNSTQQLTIGDTAGITALSGMPVQTTSSGVIAALIVFKDFQIWQVTGDTATSNLAQNFLSLTIGTSSPRSIAQSPLGLYFASIAGPYYIDQWGVLRTLTNSLKEIEPDIQVPFQNMVVPSRAAGGYSGHIYRICMETIIRGEQAFRDYWFDDHRRRWTGPHTFRYDCASQYGNYFIINSNTQNPALIKSEVIPANATPYTDMGSSVSATMWSSSWPKTGAMRVKQVVESTVELSSTGSPTSYNITAQDDIGNALNSCQVSVVPAGAQWGAAVWGGFTWASSANIPTTYTVPWTTPVVFKKLVIYITASASTALLLGSFYARFRFTGYLNTR